MQLFRFTFRHCDAPNIVFWIVASNEDAAWEKVQYKYRHSPLKEPRARFSVISEPLEPSPSVTVDGDGVDCADGSGQAMRLTGIEEALNGRR